MLLVILEFIIRVVDDSDEVVSRFLSVNLVLLPAVRLTNKTQTGFGYGQRVIFDGWCAFPRVWMLQDLGTCLDGQNLRTLDC